MKLVDHRVKAGKTETATPLEEEQQNQGGAQIIDLTELLKRSLKRPGAGKPKAAGEPSGEAHLAATKAKKRVTKSLKSPVASRKTSAAKKPSVAAAKAVLPKKRAA